MSNVSKYFNSVAAEVCEAYCDCNDLKTGDSVYSRRKLYFKASQEVSRDEAKVILEVAIPHGYNEFDASLLDKFSVNSKFVIAREGSVCIYVKGGKMPEAETVLADEKGKEGEWARFWWD